MPRRKDLPPAVPTTTIVVRLNVELVAMLGKIASQKKQSRNTLIVDSLEKTMNKYKVKP